MISRNQKRNFKPIFAGQAHAIERVRLMAPPAVKALPEHSSLVRASAHGAGAFRIPDRHIHSLGYGIDE
jgi:hypothetical protein